MKSMKGHEEGKGNETGWIPIKNPGTCGRQDGRIMKRAITITLSSLNLHASSCSSW
jgi:hypothetical protein